MPIPKTGALPLGDAPKSLVLLIKKTLTMETDLSVADEDVRQILFVVGTHKRHAIEDSPMSLTP